MHFGAASDFFQLTHLKFFAACTHKSRSRAMALPEGGAWVATLAAAVVGLAVVVRWRSTRAAAAAAAAHDVAFRRRPSAQAPWKESEKKGKNSYYYGHHTRPNDGLAAADFSMEGPRRIDPTTKKPLDDVALPAGPQRLPTSAPPGPTVQRITRYRWSDTPEQVKIFVEPAGLDFAEVGDDDVAAELTTPNSLVTHIVHGRVKYSLVLTHIRGAITKLAWKKTKKRLVLTLDKKDTALGWDREWKELISDKGIKPGGEEQAAEAD